MEKRNYSKPKILRVQLNPEQAVLSPCSLLVVSLSMQPPNRGCDPFKDKCRKWKDFKNSDSAAAS
jgi:hypothetical protein